MTDQTCPACKGTGIRDLPDIDEPTPFPCPVCRPWPDGFPGERVFLRDPAIRGLVFDHGFVNGLPPLQHWIIAPAPPGVAAKWNGWPKR